MNNTLLKGICEELEFDAEIGDYRVVSSAFDEGRMNLTITDCDNEFDSITADVRIGKLKDSGLICTSVTYKKNCWNDTYATYGELIDFIPGVSKFLKDCAIKIIKTL